jgi:hypothetical protein
MQGVEVRGSNDFSTNVLRMVVVSFRGEITAGEEAIAGKGVNAFPTSCFSGSSM